MLYTKKSLFEKNRNLISVFTDKGINCDGSPKLMGFLEKSTEDGSYKVSLLSTSGLKFGRFPRIVRVLSAQAGLEILKKAEAKIKA